MDGSQHSFRKYREASCCDPILRCLGADEKLTVIFNPPISIDALWGIGLYCTKNVVSDEIYRSFHLCCCNKRMHILSRAS
jgi:hypothetical protein